MRYRTAALLIPSCFFFVGRALATDPILDQIRREALDHSMVMDHAFYLTDVYGPRFIASPAFNRAAQWVISRMTSFGIENVHSEGTGPIGEPGFTWSQRGWSYTRFTMEMLEPQYGPLIALPVPFSPSTAGQVQGQPIRVDLPAPVEAEIDGFAAKYRGKIKGRFLLTSPALSVASLVGTPIERYTAAELEALTRPAPLQQVKQPPPSPALKANTAEPGITEVIQNYNRLNRFMRDEGVLGLLRAAGGSGGALFTSGPMGIPDANPPYPPIVDVIPEQYNRIVRLSERSLPVTLRMELQSTLHEPHELVNVIAELPGNTKKDEIVFVGAHLDSWHGGTGATDDAAGIAVVMEAMRILKKLNIPLARTVRAAFWSAEEMSARGSKGYVHQHQDDLKKIICYINMDTGAGRVRGAYFSNDQLREELTRWLAPLTDLGATTLSPRISGSSDHRNFMNAGVPSADLLQDKLRYETLTHHSAMDVFDYLPEEDLKQASAVMATLLYNAAQDEAEANKIESVYMSSDSIVGILLAVVACVFGWIVWVIATNIRRSQTTRLITEVHSKLLDRFADSRELSAFLEGTGGRQFFDAMEIDTNDSLTRILNAVQVGTVLSLAGSSLLAIRGLQDDVYIRNVLLFIGAPALASGIGFLVSATISNRICRAWGVRIKKENQAP